MGKGGTLIAANNDDEQYYDQPPPNNLFNVGGRTVESISFNSLIGTDLSAFYYAGNHFFVAYGEEDYWRGHDDINYCIVKDGHVQMGTIVHNWRGHTYEKTEFFGELVQGEPFYLRDFSFYFGSVEHLNAYKDNPNLELYEDFKDYHNYSEQVRDRYFNGDLYPKPTFIGDHPRALMTLEEWNEIN